LSEATVVAARAGKPVSSHSVRQIARALSIAPPLDGIDTLLSY
jgi:hypothetical protein